jgi:uncharacterized delta-60 repeat protein
MKPSKRFASVVIERLNARRLFAAGQLEPLFGVHGVAALAPNQFDVPRGSHSLAVQPDGKILATATINAPPGADVGVVRFNSDGLVDTGYGVAGIARVDFEAGDTADDLFVLPDGRSLVVGSAEAVYGSGPSSLALAILTPSGTLDTSFGTGGKVLASFGGSTAPTAASLARDGTLVVVTQVLIGGQFSTVVAKFNLDGTLDSRFGSNGTVMLTPAAGHTETIKAVAVQDDGKIVLGGTDQDPSNVYVAFVDRLDADGSTDDHFGSGGRTTLLAFGTTPGTVPDVAVDQQGRILAAEQLVRTTQFLVAGLNADGSVNTNFGTGGTAVADTPAPRLTATALVLQPDGEILVTGLGDNDALVARFNADGQPDSTFGPVASVPFGAEAATSSSTPFSLAISVDGKLLIGGAYTDQQSGHDATQLTVAQVDTATDLPAGFTLVDGTLIGTGTAGADSMSVSVAGSAVTSNFNGAQQTYPVALVNGVRMTGRDGNDTITASGPINFVYEMGGAGDDVMTGNDAGDELHGGKGNDSITGGTGADGLVGGAGDDSLVGGAGNDTIIGSDGNDTLIGNGGDDQLTGNAGSDSISGGAGNDSMDSFESAQTQDTVDGGAGTNTDQADANDLVTNATVTIVGT